MTAHRLGLLARPAFRWLFVVATELHLPKHAFPLHLFLERAERLIDIIVADEDLHG